MFTNTKLYCNQRTVSYIGIWNCTKKCMIYMCVFSVFISMSNIKSKSSRQPFNKCHRPSICFRITDTILLRLCLQYTSLLYGGRFSIRLHFCVIVSLSDKFYIYYCTHTLHTRLLCLGFTLSGSNFLIPTRYGWWEASGGEGYFPGFLSFSSWYIDRSIQCFL